MTVLAIEPTEKNPLRAAYEAAQRLRNGDASPDDVAVAREHLEGAGQVSDRLRAAGWHGAARPTDDVIGRALQTLLDEPWQEMAVGHAAVEPSKLASRASLLDELHREAIARAEARASGEPLGPEVAAISPMLHAAVSEALPIGMTTLDGGPGSGKTAFALQIAMTARVPALVVECEVRPVRLLERMTAFQTQTFLGKLKDGTLSPDTIRDLASRTLDELPLFELMDATTGSISMDEIVREANALRIRHASKHVLVVLDSMHAWSARALAAEKEYDRLNKANRLVDESAKRHEIAVIAILERSMATMHSPSATSGKGTTGFGYAGEITLNLDARGATNLKTGQRRINLTVSKNRYGEQDFVIPLAFEGRLQKFNEFVPVAESDDVTERLAQIAAASARGEHVVCGDGSDELDPRTGEPFPPPLATTKLTPRQMLAKRAS